MIEITETNFNRIKGRINKFFKGCKAFEVWGSYDCGGHRHVPSTFKLYGEVYNSKKFLRNVSLYNEREYVRIEYSSYDPNDFNLYFVNIGDEISFLGNRINLKKKIEGVGNHYSYATFQSVGFN